MIRPHSFRRCANERRRERRQSEYPSLSADILSHVRVSISRSEITGRTEASRIARSRSAPMIGFRSIFPPPLISASRSSIDPPYLPRSAVAARTDLLFTFHLRAGRVLPLCEQRIASVSVCFPLRVSCASIFARFRQGGRGDQRFPRSLARKVVELTSGTGLNPNPLARKPRFYSRRFSSFENKWI